MILQILNSIIVFLGGALFFHFIQLKKLENQENNMEPRNIYGLSKTLAVIQSPAKNKSTPTIDERLTENGDDLYLSLLYAHPENPDILGRPFSGLIKHAHILTVYLNTPTIKIDPNNRIKPQLLTALSNDHFKEHVANSVQLFKLFPDQQVCIFDIGLSNSQAAYFKNSTKYIYKKFNFTKYHEKTVYLTGMSWKVFVHMECLMEFGACQWFDASILFTTNIDKILNEYVYERNSSFVYYIRPAGHTTPWATHPFMFSYLPSNITKMNSKMYKMPQSGAQILFNTDELKNKFMKWAISCALTPECMFPNYELNEVRIPFGTRFNPYGTFEHKHCSSENNALRPFNCHRFDQSLFAILAQNMYGYDLSKYRTLKDEWPATPDRTAAKRFNDLGVKEILQNVGKAETKTETIQKV